MILLLNIILLYVIVTFVNFTGGEGGGIKTHIINKNGLMMSIELTNVVKGLEIIIYLHQNVYLNSHNCIHSLEK